MKISRITIIIILCLVALITVAFLFFQKKDVVTALIKNKELVEVQTENSNPRTIREFDHITGDVNAKIKIIFLGDFNDPFSQDFAVTLDKARELYKDVAVVFRNYTIRTNDLSTKIAEASECVGDQGKFWDFYHKYLGVDAEKFSFESVSNIPGIDQEGFDACMKNEKYKDFIRKESETARSEKIYGTPTIFVNDRLILGTRPLDDFVDQEGNKIDGLITIIEEAKEKAK